MYVKHPLVKSSSCFDMVVKFRTPLKIKLYSGIIKSAQPAKLLGICTGLSCKIFPVTIFPVTIFPKHIYIGAPGE